MTEIVFLLEEESAAAMLEGLLPKILPSGFCPRFVPFEGKQDLDRQLVRKIKGYRSPDAKFVVLRDQDQSDCLALKNDLLRKCATTGRSDILIRIVCRELESWFLADLGAVEMGLGVDNLKPLQNKNPYRTPDEIHSPSIRLKKITPNYQKMSGSRAIGKNLNPTNNRSHSFFAFVKGIKRLCSSETKT